MKKHCVSLQETGQFSDFFLDYLNGKEELKPFYSLEPKLESFSEAIKNKNFSNSARETLVKELHSQYEGIEISEKVKANIQSLALDQTFTVTTGHQLNLFTGPLYFIYKIVATINLAKQLAQKYPANKFVPVYWMASEDHDFDEINYFKLDGKKYQWNSDQTGAVGDFKLDDSFQSFLKSVSFAPDFFKEAYSSSKTLAEAVRKYVNYLFEEQGLVILDGNSQALKSQFKEVIKDDLFLHHSNQKAEAATQKLEELGYKGQIFPREINFFYLHQGIRERIERSGDEFKVLNTELKFSKTELEKLIETNPERFSPNVVLRPLYQEVILPNLAYLGGPAEVIYWLQLKGVFDYFEVPFPILLPRNFALLITPLIRKKIAQLGWDEAQIFEDYDSWKKEFVRSEASIDLELQEEKELISSLFEKKGEEAALLEGSLKEAFAAGKVRSLKILDQMSRKLRKAEEKKQQVQLDRALAIHAFTKPNGAPQERVVNMMQFYLSSPELIDDLLACFDPLDFRMMVLDL
ncbi:bacillithiol biosynthesis cysteine-adding enzyme BshC [Algoriphagus halophilus]|uniref:Putative cysteine ligase BshC n=1 Tax=Algoriphagus halophilus TaxID=226505 RepID=A0A1N6FLC0_9BACT|nr:bacillithiol biosynthesis cysteine-adding enzyme BshC [Algoriphagus halophilus]SIN96051.1 bacillithiol biosynthesis cysteine-adding enzyme BshC [Algoriphagus halophilus]